MEKEKRSLEPTSNRSFLHAIAFIWMILLFFFGLAISCNAFARFGGEWANSYSISVPPASNLVDWRYSDRYGYVLKDSIYSNIKSADDLRNWFIYDGKVSLSPIPLDFEGKKFIEFEGYYGTPPLFNSSEFLDSIHNLSSLFAGWSSDMTRSCQDVRVYFDDEQFQVDFPDTKVPDSSTMIVIRTCWANIK